MIDRLTIGVKAARRVKGTVCSAAERSALSACNDFNLGRPEIALVIGSTSNRARQRINRVSYAALRLVAGCTDILWSHRLPVAGEPIIGEVTLASRANLPTYKDVWLGENSAFTLLIIKSTRLRPPVTIR